MDYTNEALLNAQSAVLAAQSIGAGIAVLNGWGPGFSEGYICAKTIETIGRQPEVRSSVTGLTFVFCAVTETPALYGLLVALVLVFGNPFLGLLGIAS
jgi:F-type H+-transporting ATPase subunit c